MDNDEIKVFIDQVQWTGDDLYINQYKPEAWIKFDAACIAYLTARNLRVIDPAKVMVLERQTQAPVAIGTMLVFVPEDKERGPIILGHNDVNYLMAKSPGRYVAFGPIQLPTTEAR